MPDFEVTPEVIKAIAEQVKKETAEVDYVALAAELDKIQAKSREDLIEANKLKGLDADGKQIVSEYAEMSKEAFTVGQILAVLSGDSEKLAKMNDYAIDTLVAKNFIVNKATYLNAGTVADGQAFVPNADLLEDIFTVLPNFSATSGLLREITLTDGNSLDLSTLTADVVMTEVGTEGGTKAVTKPTMAKPNTAVREFAGIAILTKKLLKQAVQNIYEVVRDSFARAIGKTREVLMLTDATSGIINQSGVVVLTAASTFTTVDKITVKQIKSMPFQVPTASAAGGSYIFSRLLVGSLDGREDTTGQPIITITGSQNGAALSGTFNGWPFVIAETLGTTDAVSTYHAAFGNWGQYGILLRQGEVDSQVFDSGIVVDGSAVSHNLIQQNKVAMRVEIWENVGYPIPSAFAVLKTAAS